MVVLIGQPSRILIGKVLGVEERTGSNASNPSFTQQTGHFDRADSSTVNRLEASPIQAVAPNRGELS
ncbi:MAG: hypothetical protein ACI87E_002220 [Mariniblastus sp.]|jgi:hypothetical protein